MRTETLFATSDPSDPFLFTVSTEGMNRLGFRIRQDAWNLSNFLKNPIALWMHDHTQPIGRWEDVTVKNGELQAKLTLAKPGTSPFIDGIRSLIEQGILKATSVGLRILEATENKKDKVLTVTKADLREISVVSVPADPGALRAMVNLSADVRDRILRASGKPAEEPKKTGTAKMSLAERIREHEKELVSLKDKITELTAEDKDLSDEETEQLTELSEQAAALEKKLETLKKAEAALAIGSKKTGGAGRGNEPQTRKPRQKAELIFRSAYVIAKAHVSNRSLGEIILSDFGGDKELEVVTLAASNPAMTTVAGWAAELIETQIGEFLDLLSPESVWATLAGLRVTFDRMGAVRLPGRTTRTLGGSFVGEGAPIPVKQAVLTSILISPFKLGVITTMTRELAQRSSPAAEPLFRSMMIEDTAVNIDTALMDATAASAIRPAGLQVLGTGAASAGNTVADIVTDIRAMVQNMILAGAGRRPVWVMNDVRRIGLLAAFSSTEDSRPFAAEVSSGRLVGYPIITSINVPQDVVFLIDQGEFVQGYGDSPALDMSNQATLHMEDTTPLPLATGAQGSGVVATPMRSLFQTDSLALRLIWDISWAVRRAGAVQFRTGVAW